MDLPRVAIKTYTRLCAKAGRLGTLKWQFGDKLLSETKSYKYLGVIINRTRKDNDHINSHLWEKTKKI